MINYADKNRKRALILRYIKDELKKPNNIKIKTKPQSIIDKLFVYVIKDQDFKSKYKVLLDRDDTLSHINANISIYCSLIKFDLEFKIIKFWEIEHPNKIYSNPEYEILKPIATTLPGGRNEIIIGDSDEIKRIKLYFDDNLLEMTDILLDHIELKL